MSLSPITCHVLDAAEGKPAAGVGISLELVTLADAETHGATALELPRMIATGTTNADGRCTTLLEPSLHLAPGTYKITFATGQYFERQKVPTFYPVVEITFACPHPDQHYHIPLLLSPYSYTTYRGS